MKEEIPAVIIYSTLHFTVVKYQLNRSIRTMLAFPLSFYSIVTGRTILQYTKQTRRLFYSLTYPFTTSLAG